MFSQIKQKKTPLAIIPIIFFITIVLIYQSVFAQIKIESGESNVSRLSSEKMMTLTGRIDSIGADSIVINDTSFKLSDKLSMNGFKVGQIVKFVITEKRQVLKILHAKIKRKARQ